MNFKLSNISKFYGLLALLIPFILYSLTIANGLNLPDAVIQAPIIKKDIIENTIRWFGYAHNFLYYLTVISFMKILNLGFSNFDFLVNYLSVIAASLTSLVVYKVARLYFTRERALLSSILFIFIPFVWFHAINAEVYAFYALIISLWFYTFLKFSKEKSKSLAVTSSVFFSLSVFAHLITLPLVFIQIIFLAKVFKNFRFLIKNLLLIGFLLFFFIFSFISQSQREMIFGGYSSKIWFNPLVILFNVMLIGWEFFGALSIGLFALFIISIILIIKRREFDELNSLFLLILLFSSGAFFVPQYTPIIGYTSIFILIPIIMTRYFRKYFKYILIPVIFFMILRAFPVIDQVNSYLHPHYQYALWLEKNFNDRTIFSGHECPWIIYYTNLTILCDIDNSAIVYNLQLNKSVLITSQYFVNENRLEWAEMRNKASLLIPFVKAFEPQVGRPQIILNESFEKIATFTDETRNIEDPYQIFFSISRNILEKIFIPYNFSKPEYSVYQLKN